jgi:hypothetical protein
LHVSVSDNRHPHFAQQMLLYGACHRSDFLDIIAGLRLHSPAETVVIIRGQGAPAGRAEVNQLDAIHVRRCT